MKRDAVRTLLEKEGRVHAARILLAEDDADMRSLLATALRRDGYQVIEVVDGVALLERLGKSVLGRADGGSVDLIIADIRMPSLSGLDVLTRFRRAAGTTPFILITGFGDAGTHLEAARLGAAAVFEKPFDLDELRLAVLDLAAATGA
jgi:DNA-binding response OmpR family regulator